MEGILMQNQLVSIVMVNYNHEDFIEEAIESVLKQTYRNWELIIIDDGSTDQSCKIIKNYADNNKRIIPIFLEKNSHICVATNIGLDRISGEFVARLDSDDVWEMDKLEKQINYLEDNQQDICFTKLKIIDKDSRVVKREDKEDLYNLYDNRQKNSSEWLKFFFYYGNSLIQSSVLMRREVVKRVGFFNLAYVQAHDFDFFIRAAKHFEFGFIEEPLLKYRRIEKQNSEVNPENDLRFFNEYMNIRLHFFDDFPDDLFIKTFQDCFVNKDASSHEELLCEQAFLLMKCIGGGVNPVLGLIKMEELLNKPDTSAVLAEKYHFTPKMFYEENKKRQFFSYDLYKQEHDLKYELQKVKESNKHQQDHINLLLELKDKQQKYIEEIQSSISWKLTEPIRKMRKKMNNKEKRF